MMILHGDCLLSVLHDKFSCLKPHIPVMEHNIRNLFNGYNQGPVGKGGGLKTALRNALTLSKQEKGWSLHQCVPETVLSKVVHVEESVL